MSKLVRDMYAEAARAELARIAADQERRRSGAAGPHNTPKHPKRSDRRTAIQQEEANG